MTSSLTSSQAKYLAENGPATCHHISSLNETKMKQFCRKQPSDIIAYPFLAAYDLLSYESILKNLDFFKHDTKSGLRVFLNAIARTQRRS